MEHLAQSVVEPLNYHQFSLARLEGSLGVSLVSVVPHVVSDEPFDVAKAAFGQSLLLSFT